MVTASLSCLLLVLAGAVRVDMYGMIASMSYSICTREGKSCGLRGCGKKLWTWYTSTPLFHCVLCTIPVFACGLEIVGLPTANELPIICVELPRRRNSLSALHNTGSDQYLWPQPRKDTGGRWLSVARVHVYERHWVAKGFHATLHSCAVSDTAVRSSAPAYAEYPITQNQRMRELA